MTYTTVIDNVSAQKWELNIQQAYLFAYLVQLPGWAERKDFGIGLDFYFCSRNKVLSELPLLTDKPDTVYRHLVALEEKELIYYEKRDGGDYIAIRSKGKEWGRTEAYQDIPDPLGKKSGSSRKKIRKKSEKNPTYHITIDQNTNDKAAEPTAQPSFYSLAIDDYDQFCKARLNVGAKIDGAQGKAMKAILSYLKTNSQAKTEESARDGWRYILAHWDNLDDFTRSQIKLTQISSNMLNILNQLKNGTKQSERDSFKRRIDAEFDELRNDLNSRQA